MGAEFLGLKAVGWHMMVKTWWDKVLAIFLLTTILLGSIYVLFRICRKVNKYWRGRHQLSVVPTAVARYFDHLKSDTQSLSSEKSSAKELKSFGVFLGSLANPPTPDQARLLSQWDVLVLDPLQKGVLDALSCQRTSTHILGRLDVRMLVNSDCSSDNDEVIRSLGIVAQTLVTYFKRQQDMQSPFKGVLLADCQAHFQPVVLNELVKYMNGLGLDVWLEMSPPAFLTERQCRDISMKLIRGIVCRNGTILPDGDRRNYFQMAEMRTALRVIAAQRAMGGSTTVMWETVDDEVELAHDVIQRTFKWCNYNSAMCWIGPRAALTDAEIAAAKTVANEPLGALMWLKGDEVMKTHDVWRSNDKICQASCGHDALYDSLQSFIPNLRAKLSLLPPSNEYQAESQAAVIDDFDWPSRTDHTQKNPFSISPGGNDYTGLGCFQLGLDCTSKDVADLVETQRSVRELDLLERIKPGELRHIGGQLRALHDAQTSCENAPDGSQAVKELLDLVTTSNGDANDRLRVYVGLHSGFRTSSETQVWGLYDFDSSLGVLNIYLSGKTHDRTGTILHTYMSSRGYNRAQCFMAEIALSEQVGCLTETWELPPRIVHDVEQLTPTETILLLQRLVLSNCKECSIFSAKIRACCEYQLMEVPSLAQLRALNSTAYLRGEVSAEALVTSRLAWFRERGCWHPDPSAAISLFTEIDARLPEVLMNGQSQLLSKLGFVIQTILQKNQIDASADLFALSVFCAFRRLALNEVYLEVLDRNPLPNGHTVQAACFAEMFALGSRCDSFFDMTPKVLGRIISDRYRAYYKKYQPPPREEAFTELPTAYASMDIDLDPDGGQEELPVYYRVTFLGIFAVPALIDITLLTTVGRGLYLTTFMSDVEKTLATTALMVALLVCGGFGSWISSGGSYYLYAMAFPAMNMFVLTRFIAGLAVTLVGGILAMIGIGILKGFAAGIVFFFYFFMLSTYLMTLAALSIYQLPGFHFQSGRTVIMTCIPILFISPVVTLWVHHDIVVYFCVLTVFLTSLLLGARGVISQWSNWYLKIPCVTDTDVVNWFTQTRTSSDTSFVLPEGVKDVGSTPLPRQTLLANVHKERNRRFWTRSTADPFVMRMANGYSATVFLLVWYCKYSRTKMPLPYSPTWNLQLKAAVDTIGDMQKGLKLHNAFLHWRHTGAEVWCGILYFVIALMDKWTALVSGEALVGLSTASSSTYRLAVGFGLGYYLMGAVFLDAVSQPLWTLATKTTPQPIPSLKFLRQVTINDARARRSLYWKSLTKFFFLHIWGIAITSALMWTFEEFRSATTMYLAYLGAYTGLLWYQYNKIFTGSLAAKALTLGSILGFLTGILLHVLLPPFAFSSVIGLAVGTWTAAFYSTWTAKIGLPRFKNETDDKDYTGVRATPVSHTSSALEPYPEFSQTTLSQTFNTVCALPAELRYKLDPLDHPGVEVMQILLSQCKPKKSKLVQAAFRSAEQLVYRTAELWETGETVIELVSARHLLQQEQKIRAVSRSTGDRLHIFIVIGLDLVGDEWISNIHRNCKVIAEAVVQATSESRLGLSHDHSMLAELLAVSDNDDKELSVPEGVKRQLESSATERLRVINNGDKTLLRHLLLGLDCDRDWENLPKTVRSFLLRRCCGQACHLSANQASWIRSRLCAGDSLDIEEHIARCNLGANLAVLIKSFAEALEANHAYRDQPEFLDSSYERSIGALLSSSAHGLDLGLVDSFKRSFSRCHQKVKACIKFAVISLVADLEYQRELNYMIRGQPLLFAWPVTFFLNGIWSFCKTLQRIILPIVLLHGRENVSTLYRNMNGWKTVIEKHRIVIESLSGPSTCFFSAEPDGSSRLYQYSGRHDHEPSEHQHLLAINTYTDKLVLRRREEYSGQSLVNDFTYEYPQDGRTPRSKLPIQRQCIKGDLGGQVVQYDNRGYIASGSAIRGVNPVRFNFWYRKSAKFDDELIRAEYVFPHIKIKVAWSMPPPNHPERLDKWIPYPRVTEATFIQGSDVHNSKWTYDHKFHPIISTTFNGEPVATPPMIQDDWFHVLQKPRKCSFLSDNPLFSFSSVKTSFVSRMLGFNVKCYPIPTSRARTHLWKSWKGGKEFDAITTRWLDENLLRSDRVLRPYWRNRDFGRLDVAGDYLDAQADTILARVDIDPEISSWTPLAFKISDLYSFGQGGDARINTRTLSTQLQDSDSELHVLAMDTGTWPNEAGGVSACRRDMVNDLKAIKWHILAEAANDFGVPKFQIEKNVQSLTVLPQWGLDFLNPTHGVLQNCLDSAVVQKSHDTRTTDIKRNFVPILTNLVRCARVIHLTRQHIEEATKALVDLNTYFESSRNWNDVWMSDIVKKTWRELWLTEDMEDTVPVSEWWHAERPTLLQLDTALDMWHRYLFIFSIPVPEKIPDVFQVSHHFTGATYGVLCKAKRKCALHVWDHCVSFREMTVFLSSAVSFDSPFVNTTLISLGHLSCVLIQHHADVVLPCADFFNPGWEIELGTCEGVLQHRRTFSRKIDPVVNGITNMEKYKPIEAIRSKTPTVIMLSHIRYVKDIKTAIMATDLIVNDWGFTDYRLYIYGDMERAPAYASECQEIIASKSLRDHVVLKGLGNPSVVLQDAWLFMNSSISEGLPLAMGEAALTGVPVVCTDVGASFCVVTDRTTGKRFSEVVAPNDAYSLARAQISVLGLLGEWSAFAEDEEGYQPPKLAFHPSLEEVKQISKRMYDKAEHRRRFGMLGRSNVLNSFSSDRYLREHEQMLWLGKYRSRSYVARGPVSSSSSSGFLKKEKSSVEQTEDLPLTHDLWWGPVRKKLRRGRRYGPVGNSSGSQSPSC